MPLDASIELEGFDEATEATSELGKAITQYEPLLDRLNRLFGDYEKLFDKVAADVDKQQEKVTKNTSQEKSKKQELDQQKQQQAQEAEEKRLKAQMSKMLGGGVNMIAYQQQLDKLKEQMSSIELAEKKGLVTSGEAGDALSKLSKQYEKLNAEATAYAIVGGGNIGKMAAKATATLNALPGASVAVKVPLLSSREISFY
jgi:DNA-binding helix-hairpin-helix protein with protein kinase domain